MNMNKRQAWKEKQSPTCITFPKNKESGSDGHEKNKDDMMNTSGDKTQEIGRDLMQANYRDQQRLSSSKKGRPLAFYPPNRFWGR